MISMGNDPTMIYCGIYSGLPSGKLPICYEVTVPQLGYLGTKKGPQRLTYWILNFCGTLLGFNAGVEMVLKKNKENHIPYIGGAISLKAFDDLSLAQICPR